MIIGVPSETYPGDRTVAMVPAVVPTLAKVGLEVLVQQDAGVNAGFADGAYEEQGARIVAHRAQLFATVDVLLQVRGPGANPENGRADLELVRPGQVLLGLLNPLGAPDVMWELAGKGVSAFSLEMLPRIGRSQPMDMMTSMATVAGYKAVLLASETFPRMFPMMMTAAGTVAPARVLVVGAGVAGLQAIATARRLGAVVQAYDVRPVVKEQVESLGARFLETDLDVENAETSGGYAQSMGDEFYHRQQEMMTRVVAENDIIITTAAIPGKKAPILIGNEMVAGMRPGSVIVDLAAESGGNCEVTRPGETVEVAGVTVIGPVNLASAIPYHASQMYAGNLTAFLRIMVKDSELHLDLEDEIIRATLVTHQGEVVNSRVQELLGPRAAVPSADDRSEP